MAIEIISDETPDRVSEKLFEILRTYPPIEDLVLFPSVKIGIDGSQRSSDKIDFVILFPSHFAVICLKIVNGNAPDIKSFQEDINTLKEGFSSYFDSDSLLSLGGVVLPVDPYPTASQCSMWMIQENSPVSVNYSDLSGTLEAYAWDLYSGKVKNWTDEQWTESAEEFKKSDNKMIKLKFELHPTDTAGPIISRTSLETLHPQFIKLTDEQVDSLTKIAKTSHCIVDGPAGTGKTVLAMELAKRHCQERDKTVALLCSNPNLSCRFERWTESLLSNNGSKIVTGTPTTLLLRAFETNRSLRENNKERLEVLSNLEDSLKLGYLDGRWHTLIEETVENIEQEGIFDYLIVDEAQNLFNAVFLNLMNAMLKGGLRNGNWTMFGDFTYQNLVFPNRTLNVTELLCHWDPEWSINNRVRLQKNCRNTHEIATAVEILLNIPPNPRSDVRGPNIEIQYFDSQDKLNEILSNLIKNWKKRGFQSKDIILLSGDPNKEFNSEYAGWKLTNIGDVTEVTPPRSREDVLIPRGSSQNDILRYSDVYDFQGLESDLAILVIPEIKEGLRIGGDIILNDRQYLNRVLYTGISRAKTMLVIVATKDCESDLEGRIDAKGKQDDIIRVHV